MLQKVVNKTNAVLYFLPTHILDTPRVLKCSPLLHFSFVFLRYHSPCTDAIDVKTFYG